MKPLTPRFYLQVLLCAALWGSAFPVIKLSYEHLALEGFGEKLVFAGVRFIIAGSLVALFCRRSVFASFRKAPKGLLLVVCLGQTFFQYVFFYYGLSVSSGALGAILVGSGSLWWILLAPFFSGSTFPNWKQWLTFGCCLVGISVAVYAPGVGSGNVILGSFAFLLATFSGAVGAIGMKKIAPEHGSRAATSLSLFIGGILLLIAGLHQWNEYWNDFGWILLGVTLYLSCLSAVAFTVWNSLIERYSVNALSTFRFLIPLCGVLESVLFLKEETLGVGIVVGGGTVIAALFVMSRLERGES